MPEMQRFNIDGEEWISLADVCEEIGIGRQLATEPLLLAMITADECIEIDGEWFVTDAGAFDLASVVPLRVPRGERKPGPKKGHRGAPLYLQIYMFYRTRILSGIYLDGQPLPSLQFMCERWNVSHTVARDARRLLKRAGLVRITVGCRAQAVVTSKHKRRSDMAPSEVVQVGRRYTTKELEATQ
ncbi:GntR family transcriptional regulator [Streptomyces sp. NPDC127072]|uniref:GntR family transcriptional regulator n=1 Tax=Streptomyces sp. NPDC127072 TaxID=3347129 RepID=UPI003655F050